MSYTSFKSNRADQTFTEPTYATSTSIQHFGQKVCMISLILGG